MYGLKLPLGLIRALREGQWSSLGSSASLSTVFGSEPDQETSSLTERAAGVHGTPSDFGPTADAWQQGTNFSHRVLANLIERDPAYGGGSVRLLSCSTGSCGASAAQNLANKLGVEVMALTDTLWAFPSGELTVGPLPDMSTGGWANFYPGG